MARGAAMKGGAGAAKKAALTPRQRLMILYKIVDETDVIFADPRFPVSQRSKLLGPRFLGNKKASVYIYRMGLRRVVADEFGEEVLEEYAIFDLTLVDEKGLISVKFPMIDITFPARVATTIVYGATIHIPVRFFRVYEYLALRERGYPVTAEFDRRKRIFKVRIP